jgi:predicted phage terminase large subunit-like protein
MSPNFDELLRQDALTFARRAHYELHQTKLGEEPYLHLLTYDIERIVSGHLRRYICNLPPGHGKTVLFSVTQTAWILGHNPSARILIVSYGEDLATDIARKIRTILQARWFRRVFPKTVLAKDQKAARDFATAAGGRVCARSIDGAITGVRCDYLIVDDPVQIRDSGDVRYLEVVNARFDTDLMSRLNNPQSGAVVIVHHRLNRSDLTGYLEKRSDWKRRKLPLVAPEDRNYTLKGGVWRRKVGEVLRPDAYSSEYIAHLRENTAAPGYGPLYQQRFDGADMLQVNRCDFVIQPLYARPPVPYVLSIDPNHKGEDGHSYGVIQCWAMLVDGRYLLYDQWRGRAHKSVFAGLIRRMKAKYRPEVILIEDNGPALDFQEQIETSMCPVILLSAVGNKLTRLRRHLDSFQNHKILLRAGLPFLEELIAEFEAFPYGANDDLVDAATQFLDWAESNDAPVVTRSLPVMGALGNARRAREMLYWNAGRPRCYVFSRY